MTTASDIVNSALGLILTRSANIPLEADEMQDGIIGLNDMMASWNLALGYKDVSSSSDTITSPAYANLAIKENLAIHLAPGFGGIVDADLRLNARKSKSALLRIVVNIGPAKMPRTLPRGTGNTRNSSRNQIFYNPPKPTESTDGLILLAGNTSETTISTASTPVVTNGGWSVVSTHQMIATAAGRLTYTPTVDGLISVTAKATILMASSGSKVVSAFLALNGVALTATASATATDTAAAVISFPWELELSTGDYLELWVSNASDTVNLIVSDASLRLVSTH